jgi:hypothetical protein
LIRSRAIPLTSGSRHGSVEVIGSPTRCLYKTVYLRLVGGAQPKYSFASQLYEKPGQVVFPGIGPLSDDDFIDLVRHALQSGYCVYVKDLPIGQPRSRRLKQIRARPLPSPANFANMLRRFGLNCEDRRRENRIADC